jgi:subtilisin family serine protease
MSNKTYVDLVNDVLIRLRESEVQTVAQNPYSKLIGKFINDGKRQVEDAYSWNVLRNSISINTVAGVFKYTLTGSGIRFKVFDVSNDTDNYTLDLANTSFMNHLFLQNQQQSAPQYYNFNGIDSNNDTQVDIYPIPDKVYNLDFNIIKPQAELSLDSTIMLVPNEPVIFYAYARALAERGEDGGLQSGEAYQLYLQSLSDHISIESSRANVDIIWTN